MNFLRQSTASQIRSLGAFVDDTDGKTPETGLTIANTDVKLIKNGAASVNKNSGGGTHRANGFYGFTFNATDTNTVGELEISIKVAGALSVWKTFFVLEEAVYDLFYTAASAGKVQLQAVTHTGAVIPTVTTLTNLPAITANWLTAAGIAAGALNNKGNWNIGKTGYSLAATGLDAIASTATGMVEIAKAIWDRVLTGATHNIAASAGRRLRSVGDVTSGTVNDAAATTTSFISTLTGAHDDHFADQTLFFTDGALAGMSRIITSYISSTKEITFDEPLPAAPGDGDAFDVNPVHVHTQTQIAEVVWNEDLAGHTTAGTSGKAIVDTLEDTNEMQTDWADGGRLDTILDARMAESSINTTGGAVDLVTANTDMRGTDNAALATDLAIVDAIVDAILADTSVSIPALIAALNDPSAAAIVSAVWSDTLTTYTDGEAGARVRKLTDLAGLEVTVNDVAATTTSFITDQTGINLEDNTLKFLDGANAEQSKVITTHNTTTGEMTFDEPFDNAPANGAAAITGLHTHSITQIQAAILSDATPFEGANIAAILEDTAVSIPALIAALNDVSTADILASGDVDGFNLEETLKIILAMAAGKLSGATTPTIVIRAADDSKVRITSSSDGIGNRTATVLDGAG